MSSRTSLTPTHVAMLFVAPALVVVLGLFVQRAEASRYCNEQVRCTEGSSCVDNRCVLDTQAPQSARAQPERSAAAECGSDRRCRIARLARKNRARRRLQQLEEERRLERIIEARYQREYDSVVRRKHPWVIALHSYADLGVGLSGGYALTPRIRAEVSLHGTDSWVYSEVGDQVVDGSHDLWEVSVGSTYYFSDERLSPYARGAFSHRSGTFHTGWASTENARATEFHILTGAAGVDAQFVNGFQVRLGLLYRFLLFHQARIDAGEYDETVREALGNEFTELDLEFLVGWAF